MNSIFVIGGELIEMLDGSNDFALFRRRQTAKQHRYNSSMNRETKKALTSLEKSRDASGSEASMFEHWKKTSFYPVSEFGKLTRRQQIFYVKNPHLFAVWGVGKQLEVIGMHYDYIID